MQPCQAPPTKPNHAGATNTLTFTEAKQVMMYTNLVLPAKQTTQVFLLRLPVTLQSTRRRRGVDCAAAAAGIRVAAANMSYRTVVMYMEIGCFVVCVAGWILVCSTMPTEIWTWSEVDSIVLTTSNYFSNLWKDCISDSTGVSDCKGIPSMLALNCEYNRAELWAQNIQNRAASPSNMSSS